MCVAAPQESFVTQHTTCYTDASSKLKHPLLGGRLLKMQLLKEMYNVQGTNKTHKSQGVPETYRVYRSSLGCKQ